jgi:hypothetical protein
MVDGLAGYETDDGHVDYAAIAEAVRLKGCAPAAGLTVLGGGAAAMVALVRVTLRDVPRPAIACG